MSLASLNPLSMVTAPNMFGMGNKLEHAKIVTVDRDGNKLSMTDDRKVELEFQFNPQNVSITKEVRWKARASSGIAPEEGAIPHRNAPELDFGGGKAAEFDLDLIFDTTKNGEDVRQYTQELLRLVMRPKGSRRKRLQPPSIRFEWGKFMLFIAVVTKVKIKYVLFLPDGTPIRANASVHFLQNDTRDDQQKGTNPTTRTEPRKTRIVQSGDRLDLIAFQEYGDVGHWRYLAKANSLSNPSQLKSGQVLVIPELP